MHDATAKDLALAELCMHLRGWWGAHDAPFLSESLLHEISGWEDYYRGHKLDFDSPVALLLDGALTTVWAARRYQALFLEKCDTNRPLESLNVLVLGASLVEVMLWPTFLELGYFAKFAEINLWLVGPEVPQWAHNRSVRVQLPLGKRDRSECSEGLHSKEGHLTVHCIRGLCHECTPEGFLNEWRPHVVMGLNAGLAAYKSWVPTLQLLHIRCEDSGRQQPPMVCCFSDFNEEAVERSLQLCRAVLDKKAAAVQVYK